MSRRPPKRPEADPRQLELPFGSAKRATEANPRGGLRLIRGEGKSLPEKLNSREAVVRVLLEAGVDLLLRRISAERAEEIESRVDRILTLFDRADPSQSPESADSHHQLRTELDELERLMTETRGLRPARRRSV